MVEVEKGVTGRGIRVTTWVDRRDIVASSMNLISKGQSFVLLGS
jgi:hypothetical protein